MRTQLTLIAALLGLAACGGPESNVWACAGQSDLVVTEDDETLIIETVNTGERLVLTEVDEGVMWTAGTAFWQITGLDRSLFQTADGKVRTCRRPG